MGLIHTKSRGTCSAHSWQLNTRVSKNLTLPSGVSITEEMVTYVHHISALSQVKYTVQNRTWITVELCGRTGEGVVILT